MRGWDEGREMKDEMKGGGRGEGVLDRATPAADARLSGDITVRREAGSQLEAGVSALGQVTHYELTAAAGRNSA